MSKCNCGSAKPEGEKMCQECERLAIDRNIDGFKESIRSPFTNEAREAAKRYMAERRNLS